MHPPEIVSWTEAVRVPAIHDTDLHIWKLDLATTRGKPSPDLLSTVERARAERFRSEGDANRFVAVHSAVREILAGYLHTSAGRLRFTYGAKGKPELASPHHWLRFNLTHSRDIALLAVNLNRPVGIDVEQTRHTARLPDIARRLFKEEPLSTAHATLDERWVQLFYARWTAMEAGLKAWGLGVFDQQPDTVTQPLHIRHFIPQLGYLAAVARLQLDPGPASNWQLMIRPL